MESKTDRENNKTDFKKGTFDDSFPQKIGTENKRMVSAATLAMVVLIIILIIFTHPDQVNPGEFADQQSGKNNIFILLKQSYSMYEKGEFANDIFHGTPDSLFNLISSYEVDTDPLTKRFSDSNLTEVFFYNTNEVVLPHFIYKGPDNKFIFAVQFPFATAGGKQKLSLSGDLINYLKDGNCFSTRQEDLIYLLKMYGDFIWGFVLEKPGRAIISEICSRKD